MKITENRHRKEAGSKKSVKSSMLASLHSIIICTLALAAFCFAWFSEVVQGPGFTIRAATYGIQAEVSSNGAVTGEGDSTATGEDRITMEVENGKIYDITLTATGNSSQGFCIVSAGDVIYHTAPMKPGEQLSFRVEFPGSETRVIEFVPYWGQYRKEISAGDEVSDGNSIGNRGRAVSPGDSSEAVK